MLHHQLLLGACKLDALGSPGMAPYWKFVDLFVYSVGPFFAALLVNIAIIVSISRARRRRNKFVSPRVRFNTMLNCRTTEGVDGAALVVELPARCKSGSDEMREALDEQSAPAELHRRVIKDDAIPKRSVPQKQTSKYYVLYCSMLLLVARSSTK